jgi:hypothetical protein
MSLSRPPALDPIRSLDEPLEAALRDAAEVNRATRLSIEIRLYHPKHKEYRLWKDVSWKIPLTTTEDGRAVIKGIDLLLQAMEQDAAATLLWLEAQVEAGAGRLARD